MAATQRARNGLTKEDGFVKEERYDIDIITKDRCRYRHRYRDP